MNGVVRSAGKSLSNAKVTLHRAGVGAVASGTTEGGTFSFDVTEPGFHYVTADGGEGVLLTAIVGSSRPSNVVVNELTTVAAAYAAAQCFNGTTIEGSELALKIVEAMNANLVDVASGTPSDVITSSPNADQTNAYRSLMSLANFVATTASDAKARESFFKLTTLPPPHPAPSNTFEGIVNIARNPAYHVGAIYARSLLSGVYGPVLTAQPIAWTIVVKVNNSGDPSRMFGGPGSLEFDKSGNAWIPNNVVQGTPNSSPYSIVLDLSGRPLQYDNDAPLSPFEGGGLRGPGFGVAIDGNDEVWMGNFGWGDDKPEFGGASKFSLNDNAITALSPEPYGYVEGGANRVQGTTYDPLTGNIWLAGWGNGTVVCYRKGDPQNFANYVDQSGSFSPFGIAITSHGTAWVTNSNGSASSLIHLEVLPDSPSLRLLKTITIGKVLKGIQIDSAGRIWVASGGDHHIYVFDESGNFLGGYQGGGTNGPWGIRLDGDENLWVGNFGPLELGSIFHGRLTQLAGANTPGFRMGDGMTPPTGYTLPSEGDPVILGDNKTPLYGNDAPPSYIPMMRTTGLNIDAAGNVWTCNNWKPDFDTDALFDPAVGAANPGGDGMLIWVGLAKPPAGGS